MARPTEHAHQKDIEATGSMDASTQNPPLEQIQTIINLFNEGEIQEALERASQTLQHFSNSIILYNIQGAANAALGFLDEAVASYIQALAIKPDFAGAYNNMGNTYIAMGKLEEAILAYQNYH